jgi:hypothetical protein
MALLAQLSDRFSDLRKKTTGTEALGLLLQAPAASAALAAAVRVGAPDLPSNLIFTTQASDDEGRPDLAARDAHREVLLVECKFWFGFTPAQSNGAYLRRLSDQHAAGAPSHPHAGALLFVVPPRRRSEVWGKLLDLYSLSSGEQAVGEWRFATSPSGVVVALCDWQSVLESIAAVAGASLAADCAQLLALVDAVDRRAFAPWSVEQVTDQDTAKRVLQLVQLVESVRREAIRKPFADAAVGRRVTIKRGALMFGKTMDLGGVPAILSVSLYHWAANGQSPLWLRFRAGADIARDAFGSRCIPTDDGVAVAVPLPTDQLEQETISTIVGWLEQAAADLSRAKEKAQIKSKLIDEFPDEDMEE